MDYFEVEVKARGKDGRESVVYGEYLTGAENAHEAAREVVDHVIKRTSNERMREIDPAE